MALRDAKLIMSDKQEPTTTAASTDVIDFGVANPNVGAGNPVYVDVRVNVALESGTSIKATLQDSADNSTFATLLDGAVVTQANAISGKVLLQGALPNAVRRYVRINYTIVGTFDAGSLDASIGLRPAD